MRKHLLYAFAAFAALSIAASCDDEVMTPDPDGTGNDSTLVDDTTQVVDSTEVDTVPMELRFVEAMNFCYPPMQNLFQFWTNLTIDLYCGYFMTPNGLFVNGDMGENRGHGMGMHQVYYDYIFGNTRRVIAKCEADGRHGLAGVMRVVQAYGTLMATDAYGPIAYSSLLEGGDGKSFDSQRTIYKHMLEDLNKAVDDIREMPDSERATLAILDTWLNGNVDKWVKVANQFRLRMAMRLTKRGREAKEMGIDIREIARQVIEEDGGVLTSADGDVTIDRGLENEMWLMFSWGDCAFGADLVTLMVGMDDPRLPFYMTKNRRITTTDGRVILEPEQQYLGIPFASGLPEKPNPWGSFSNWIGGDDGSTYYMPLPIMKCAEGYFLRAEAKLRWDIGSETVQELYEQGISTSISAEYGYRGFYIGASLSALDVDNYIAGTGVQIDYVDPIVHFDPSLIDPDNTDPTLNDREAMNDLCVAWDESATDEQKLQRIITQKYIALFPLSVEAWAECRRTGYPILFKGRVNESENTNGATGFAVNTDEGVRRLLYPVGYYGFDTDEAALAEGIRILNEENSSLTITGDHGGTRVWWDNAMEDNFSNDGD